MSRFKDEAIFMTKNAFTQAASRGWTQPYKKPAAYYHPADGLTVEVDPRWQSVAGFVVNPSPGILIYSAFFQKCLKTHLKIGTKTAAIRIFNQQVERYREDVRFPISFIEEVDSKAPSFYAELHTVPEYIDLLLTTVEDRILPNYDMSGDLAFLRSLPDEYQSYNPRYFWDAQAYTVSQILKGNKDVTDQLLASQKVSGLSRDYIEQTATLGRHADDIIAAANAIENSA
ncbi:hypothetical protein FQV27_08575 [Paracoccus aurantiacus]|uniref:Uncharacterized protein n=1 Tax=Paracoccus aurantiacus TaxID=2599412 RepID=A0A5C6S3I3_9RHOB|nr:hypothetical protein [Paracoccus aurantiacus]TXB69026.1 hypothetical protein FQV27_08575 [Paracoccus aurantiacus]